MLCLIVKHELGSVPESVEVTSLQGPQEGRRKQMVSFSDEERNNAFNDLVIKELNLRTNRSAEKSLLASALAALAGVVALVRVNVVSRPGAGVVVDGQESVRHGRRALRGEEIGHHQRFHGVDP